MRLLSTYFPQRQRVSVKTSTMNCGLRLFFWCQKSCQSFKKMPFTYAAKNQTSHFLMKIGSRVNDPQPCRMRSKTKAEEDTQSKVGRAEGETLDSLRFSFVYINLGKFIDPVGASKPWRSPNRIRFNLMTTNEQDMFIYKCRICYCTVTEKTVP